ncbi:Fc.00g024800.m01.CDS01 [Cosmosporella sp. VM-42]
MESESETLHTRHYRQSLVATSLGIQEFVLAKRATVHYGGLSASWDMFSRAATFYLSSSSSQDPQMLTRAATSTVTSAQNYLESLSNIILQVETTRKALIQGLSLPPLEALRRFHGREATDPRDKVFGLVGLLDKSFLTPDYGMSK